MSSKLKAGTSTSGAVLEADTTGILELQTGSTPTTAITVDALQNVGIGTASPASYGNLAVYNASNALSSVANSLSYSQLQVNGYDLYINQNVSGANSNAGSTIFRRGGSQTESMRIASDGAILMGKTATDDSTAGFAYRASNYISVVRSGGAPCYFNRLTSTGTIVEFAYNSSTVGSISYNGTTTLYNATSDQRLKENIVDAGSGLAKLANVQIRSFDWIANKEHTDFGVVAQELVNVAPEAVLQGDLEETVKDTWQVDTSVLVPAMIKAIQELNAKVTDLEAKLGAK